MGYALITGASKGIGRAIAFEFAKRKIDVLLVARSEVLLKELSEELKQTFSIEADYVVADLSSANAPSEIYQWCNRNGYAVKYLVNNAGYGLSGKFESYALKEHMDMLSLNANALVEMCHRFLSALKQQNGFILNVASTSAYQALPNMAVYAASKAFVLQFSRALHHELKGVVSVTCVSPGPTETNFNATANLRTKALKAADKVQMSADAVAKIAVDSMFKGKTEVVVGAINKLGAFAAWLAPKSIVEKTAGSVYE